MNHKLTDTDIRILSEIELKGTAPVKESCKALKMKEANFRYHLRKLYASNLLRLVPEIDFSALGYSRYRILLSLNEEFSFSTERALQALGPFVFAARITELSGEFTHAVSLVVESDDLLKAALSALSSTLSGTVKEKRIMKIEASHFLGRDYLLGSRERKKPAPQVPLQVTIDKREASILKHLFNAPYRARTELAKSLSIAPSSLEYKILKLEKLGIIRSWHKSINTQLLGIEKYHLLLSLNSLSSSAQDKLIEKLSFLPNIVEIHKTLGAGDLSLTVESQSAREFLSIRAEVLKLVNGDLSFASSFQLLAETDLYSVQAAKLAHERLAA